MAKTPTPSDKPAKKTAKKAPAKTAAPAPSGDPSTPSSHPLRGVPTTRPVYAEPDFSDDPLKYKTPHASDDAAYKELDELTASGKFQPLPFPVVAGVDEPVLTLAAALGPSGAATVAQITKAGRIVFHSAGDTGATRGPKTENDVVDKLVADFSGETPDMVPQFFYNLGDIVYSFGEHKYYYDQFYEAYRNYPAPIFAIPGNHDGLVLPPPAGTGNAADSLNAFLENFCAPGFAHASDAMGLSRTTMIQPGPYFTLDAPLVRILGLYSNVLENPGVIATSTDPSGKVSFPDLGTAQLTYLEAALTRIKKEKFTGAVIFAVHHPPYSYGKHSGSLVMLKQMDAICTKVGVWPHAVLSGHAHNFQRFTRTLGKRVIPYYVIGNGGHGLTRLSIDTTLRTPISVPIFAQPELGDSVVLNNYDYQDYGYLRILVDAAQLRIEYHPASDGMATKTPDDSVTVDLKSGTLVQYVPPA